jgi:hypothetical protein
MRVACRAVRPSRKGEAGWNERTKRRREVSKAGIARAEARARSNQRLQAAAYAEIARAMERARHPERREAMTKVVAIKREIEPPIKAGVEPGRPKKGAKLGKARDIIAKRDRRRKEPGALAAAQLAFGEFWSIRNAYLARHGAMMIAARGLLAAKRLHRGNRAFGRWLRQSALAVCNQPEVSAMIWLARNEHQLASFLRDHQSIGCPVALSRMARLAGALPHRKTGSTTTMWTS